MDSIGNWISILTFGLSFLPMLITPLIMSFVFRLVFNRVKGNNPVLSQLQHKAGGCFAVVRWGIRLAAIPVSLFIGLMIVTIGGVAQPKIPLAAAHYICDGETRVNSQDYSYKPGQRGTSITFICTDAQGKQEDISFKLLGVATLYYSAIVALFLLPLTWLVSLAFKPSSAGAASPSQPGPTPSASADSSLLSAIFSGNKQAPVRQIFEKYNVTFKQVQPENSSESVASRIQQLNALHDKGLLSDAEYETKKAEVLRSL